MYANVIILFATWTTVMSARILVVVSTPSISHQLVFRPLIQELVNRDHEVVVLTPDPAFPEGKSRKNLKEIDLHDLSYMIWQKICDKLGNDDYFYVMTVTFHVLHETFYEQLRAKSVQKLVTDSATKFDLLILEECAIPTVIFSHIFEAPVIVMSSFGDIQGSMDLIGALTHPLLYPTYFHQRIHNLTLWEKINELYNHIKFSQTLNNLDIHDDKILKSLFGIETPALNELRNNINILMLNTHPIWLNNQPVPSNFVHMWGIHKVPEKRLPKDLQDYLDSSENGAIYVSFGTNYKSSTMNPKTLHIFLKVFSQLPYNILWKWDMDELPGKSDNIKISKWFPQNNILRHPKLKLFITHGGLQSTDEAINAGVPLIGIPTFSDQFYNTGKYEHFKIGHQLRMKSLTEESLNNTIKTILSDYDNYRKNIIQLQTQMHDRRKPSLENAISWIDYVLRHGGARHLRSSAANMSWTQYYELELVFVVLGGLITFITVLTITLCSYLRHMLRYFQCFI